jgi:hypothetical protein
VGTRHDENTVARVGESIRFIHPLTEDKEIVGNVKNVKTHIERVKNVKFLQLLPKFAAFCHLAFLNQPVAGLTSLKQC